MTLRNVRRACGSGTMSLVKTETHSLLVTVAIGVLAVILIASLLLYYREYAKSQSLAQGLTTETNAKAALANEKDSRIAELEATIASTTELLHLTEEARGNLESRLSDKEDEVDALSSQVKKISGTVGVLDKLAKTDKEFLMKYSKVYFLNEHYTPAKLSKIDEKYSAVTTDQYLESRVYDKMQDMIEDAKRDGVDIKVRSAYRSFESQKNLKSAYSVSYGAGANTFSADQGYSEHQLGTTADLTSSENANQLAGFDTTEAFKWLQKNAQKYGFTLSYPKGNAFYIYEPWHWRYVGEKLADDLHEDSKFFYDLDQREIDKYLVDVFE